MSSEKFPFKTHQDLVIGSEIADRPLVDMIKVIKELYLDDLRPWIIGFSGGKDSTAVLSLIYFTLLELPKEQRKKKIYVVSSDTLVETPMVVDLLKNTMKMINESAADLGLPITAHAVHPKKDQTFWVNLLGRGYPAPRQQFRWCTERMKIDPVSTFITKTVASHGEVIVVLGSRSQESSSRAQVVARHKIKGSKLSRHTTLHNAYTYMPIVDWSADDVWEYLMSAPCPWPGTNRQLFDLYRGSNQGECPMVIDKSTPSCGNSRFGCWTCTVVQEDKALHGLIEDGQDWMKPLLDFRNKLFVSTDPDKKAQYRNFKRRMGKVSYASGTIDDDVSVIKKHVPGPYWMKQRQSWLRELLEIERDINLSGHEVDLIRFSELEEIRQQWLRDPNEPDWADSLPEIYSAVYPERNPIWVKNDFSAFQSEDLELLENVSLKFNISAAMIQKLVEVEIEMSGLSQRRGVLKKLQSVLSKDWETLEEINERNEWAPNSDLWREKIEDFQNQLDEFVG